MKRGKKAPDEDGSFGRWLGPLRLPLLSVIGAGQENCVAGSERL